MTEIPVTDAFVDEIANYADHCQRLKQDLDAILEDYGDGSDILYAVDFSEIYAYVLPDDSHENAPFDDGWAGDHLRQTVLLEKFFRKGNIVLPEPYIVELHPFFDRVAMRAFGDETTLLLNAYTELQRLKRTSEFDRIRKLSRQAERRELTPEEIAETLKFFETRGSMLVAFARGSSREPLERMRRLLKGRPFVPLDSIMAGTASAIDDRVVNDMFHRLVIRRKSGTPASSKVDALAIEHVRAANHVLRERKAKLLLVSRSQHMIAAVHESASGPAWIDVRPFIRHPRTFSAAYNLATAQDREALIRRVRLRKEMLDLFIHAVADAQQQSSGIAEDRRQVLRKKMSEIQDEWSSGEQLANAIPKDGETSAGEAAELARKYLSFLRADAILKTAKKRIIEIFDETARDLGLIGAKVQTPEVTFGSVLYPVELSDPELRALVEDLAREWAVTAGKAAELFDLAAKQPLPNHEFLLAIAITLGAIGRWSVAEQYAAQAVNLADSKAATTEAQFIHALTLRKLLHPKKSPAEELQHLYDARAAILRALEARPTEPRYLNELGVIEAYLLRVVPKDGRREARAKVGATFERARETEHSDKLEAQILNNLAYLYYAMPPHDHDQAQKYLTALEHQLDAMKTPREKWPSFIVDTLIFGRYRMNARSMSLEMLVPMINELTPIAEKRDLTRAEQSQVRAHVKEMNDMRAKLERPTGTSARKKSARRH